MNNNIACPECERKLVAPSSLQGRLIRCPHCKHVFRVEAIPPTDEANVNAEPLPATKALELAPTPLASPAEPVQDLRPSLDPGDDQLSRLLRLFAMVPLGVLGVMAFLYWRGVESWEEIIGLPLWGLVAVALSVQTWRWSRAGTPAVAWYSVICTCAIVLIYAVPLAILFRDRINLPDALSGLKDGTPAAPLDESLWTEFKDPKSQFKLDMPGVPQLKVENVPGQPEGMNTYIVDLKRVAFFIGYGDIPPREFGKIPLEQRFEGARNGMLQKTKNSRLVSEKDVEMEGFPGREFFIEIPKQGNMVARALAVENRFYILLAAGPHYSPDSTDVKRFFGSFRVQTQSVPVASATSFEGLLGYWSFDEADGDQALDGSGAGNHGKIVNAKRVTGKRGKGLRFDGTGHVDIGSSPRFNFKQGAPFTVAGWFKNEHGEGNIVVMRNTRDRPFNLYAGTSRTVLNAGLTSDTPGGSGNIALPNGSADDHLWHHFALLRHASGAVELYFDGASAGKGQFGVTGAILTHERRFGATFRGVLDELCLFNRTLTEPEIKALVGKIPDFVDRPVPPVPVTPPDQEEKEPPYPLVVKYFAAHYAVKSLCFSPDGKRLLGAHSSVEIWDTDTGKSVRTIPGRRPCLLAANGEKVLYSDAGGDTVMLTDLSQPTSPPRWFRGKLVFVNYEFLSPQNTFFALAPDESFLLTTFGSFPKYDYGRGTRSVCKYDFKTGEVIATWPKRPTAHTTPLVIAPNGACYAMATDSAVEVYSTRTGKLLVEGSLPAKKNVVDLTFAPTGKTLVFNVNHREVYTMDLELGVVAPLHRDPPLILRMPVFTPNGQYLVGVTMIKNNDHVVVWDIAAKKIKQQWIVGEHVHSMALSADCRRLAVNRTYDADLVRPSTNYVYDFAVALQITDAERRLLAQHAPIAPLPARLTEKE